MKKRKQPLKDASKKRRIVQRYPSTLIDCPACGKRVCDSVLGIHLDTDCPSRKAEANEGQGNVAQETKSKAAVKGVTVAYAKSLGGGQAKPVPLTEEELLEHSPCGVVRNALPLPLADSLLKNIAEDAKNWVRGTWWMFGKEHIAPRSSAFFEIVKDNEEQGLPNSEDSSREVSIKVETREASQELKDAALRINQIVNDSKKKRHPEEPSDDWGCTYALANWYQDGQDSVGSHSDRMTLLGPRPVIASLSLGATRTFRLKKGVVKDKRMKKKSEISNSPKKGVCSNGEDASKGSRDAIDSDDGLEDCGDQRETSRMVATAGGLNTNDPDGVHTEGSKSTSAEKPGSGDAETSEVHSEAHTSLPQKKEVTKSFGQFTSVDIPLPHNTLVIMWPPCQEEWRHEVPKCSNLKFQHHPLSGTGRLNLTFRMLRSDWAAKVPKCRCGRGAIMKARVGVDSGGKTMYYYSCDTTQGKPCGYFEWVKM